MTTYFQDISSVIRMRFKSLVADAYTIPTQYDNASLDIPEDSTWVRLVIQHDSSEQLATGNGNTFRGRGQAIASIFVPIEQGDADALILADRIRTEFRQVTDGQVRFETPSIQRAGRVDNEKWWEIDVNLPWRADLSLPLQVGTGTGTPNFETLGNIIRERFRSLVAAPNLVITQYDNSPLDPPDNEMWVYLSILTGDTIRTEGYAGRYRTTGLVVAMIFIPLDFGDGGGMVLADKIADAFRAVTDQGVVFLTPSVTNVGRTEAVWQINVSCPFYSDEI